MSNFERASNFLRRVLEEVGRYPDDAPVDVLPRDFSRDFYRDVVRKQGVGE